MTAMHNKMPLVIVVMYNTLDRCTLCGFGSNSENNSKNNEMKMATCLVGFEY